MKSGNRYSDSTLILLLVAIFIFHSPFTRWWASLDLPWYSIFLFWFAVIILVALNQLRQRDHPKTPQ